MHENRETSETPAGSHSRTAGEGLGRNTRMHVAEESDSRFSRLAVGCVATKIGLQQFLLRVTPRLVAISEVWVLR